MMGLCVLSVSHCMSSYQDMQKRNLANRALDVSLISQKLSSLSEHISSPAHVLVHDFGLRHSQSSVHGPEMGLNLYHCLSLTHPAFYMRTCILEHTHLLQILANL